jgi:hypothetical protein
MLTQTYLSNISLVQAMIDTQINVQKWLRRCSLENIKNSIKQVPKFAFGNSLILFDTMLKQAKQYDNMIEACIQSLTNCNKLSLDICGFSILRIISDSKDPELDDEANVQ